MIYEKDQVQLFNETVLKRYGKNISDEQQLEKLAFVLTAYADDITTLLNPDDIHATLSTNGFGSTQLVIRFTVVPQKRSVRIVYYQFHFKSREGVVAALQQLRRVNMVNVSGKLPAA